MIRRIGCLLWAVLLGGLTACHDHSSAALLPDDGEEGTDPETGNVHLCLQLTVYPPDASATTRAALDGEADEADEACHPFYTELSAAATAAENEIRTLTVFLVDTDEQGADLEEPAHIQAATTYVSELTDAQTSGLTSAYRLLTRFVTPAGPKHVYIGANLSSEQITAFCDGNLAAGYGPSEATTLRSLMSHFMAYDGGDLTYTGRAPSMFTQAAPTADAATEADAAGQIFRVQAPGDPTEQQIYETQGVHLERTVAKVLLACRRSRTSQLTEEYVDVVDANETALLPLNATDADRQALQTKYRGWAHDSTLFYLLHRAARTLRLHGDEVTTVGDYLSPDVGGAYTPLDAAAYAERYLTYADEELVFASGDKVRYPFTAANLRRRIALYDGTSAADRLYFTNEVTADGTVVSPLAGLPTEGIYCLPNLFCFGNVAEGTALDDVAQQVATYVVAAVRYIPRYIHCLVTEDVAETDAETGETKTTPVTAIRAQEFPDLATALDTLKPPVTLRNDDGTETTYPAETYWVLIKNTGAVEYYTGAAVAYEVRRRGFSSWTQARFRCYERGYNYYRTYIDPQLDPATGTNSYDYDVRQHADQSPLAERRFGLERNHYYILLTDAIAVPGSSTAGSPMALNANLIDWDEIGIQEETLSSSDYE